MPRTDRDDVSTQIERVARAREALADALQALVSRCAGQPDLADVADEARILVRALASGAKRPPPVDVAPLFGAVSASQRAAVRSDDFDAAVASVRAAESALDLAVYDLATARGADG